MKSRGPTVLGLLFEGLDPAAALIAGGEIVAFAEEERFTRKKHASGAFPSNAVGYCLAEAGREIEDVDYIAVGWDASKFPVHMAQFYLSLWHTHQPCAEHVLRWQLKNLTRYTPENLERQIVEHLLSGRSADQRPEIKYVPHHFAHACSSVMLSGWDETAVITADGHGEDDCTNLWLASAQELQHLQQWRLPASLGWFYTKFTEWFGFQPHDGEGKLMGLAAYGRPVPELLAKVRQVLDVKGGDDVYLVEPDFFFKPFLPDTHFTAEWHDLFGPPRRRDSNEPFSDYHKNLAFAVQDALETVGLALLDRVLSLTGARKVCVAGGTFMNCKMNGVLARRVGMSNFFAQPLAGDNGIALGAALAMHRQSGLPMCSALKHLYYGPAFSPDEIERELQARGLAYERPSSLEAFTARLLAESRVVGWFQGRMEAGARALGNRSILGNPLNPDMSDIINRLVKFREPWRPFCPSTMVDDADKHFDYTGDLPYMIVACHAKDGARERLRSVVHVDDTVRLQTVSRDTNTRFYGVINEFRKLTGYGVLLNTSFNVKGEPIVCSPKDAIDCYLRTGIDVLVIGDFIVRKKENIRLE